MAGAKTAVKALILGDFNSIHINWKGETLAVRTDKNFCASCVKKARTNYKVAHWLLSWIYNVSGEPRKYLTEEGCRAAAEVSILGKE